MGLFNRKNKPKVDPNVGMAQSIVNTVIDCHRYHIPDADIVKYVAGYLDQWELAIRSAMGIEKMEALPFLKAHFDANRTEGLTPFTQEYGNKP